MQGDASEIRELAADISAVPARMIGPTFKVFKDVGLAFAAEWQDNARESSGEHGKHYPNSITTEARVSTDIVIETGPDNARKQGRMGPGFEFGSRNQPPHLDGAKALDAMELRVPRMIDAAIGFLL